MRLDARPYRDDSSRRTQSFRDAASRARAASVCGCVCRAVCVWGRAGPDGGPRGCAWCRRSVAHLRFVFSFFVVWRSGVSLWKRVQWPS